MFNSLPSNSKTMFRESDLEKFFTDLRNYLLSNPFNESNEFCPQIKNFTILLVNTDLYDSHYVGSYVPVVSK